MCHPGTLAQPTIHTLLGFRWNTGQCRDVWNLQQFVFCIEETNLLPLTFLSTTLCHRVPLVLFGILDFDDLLLVVYHWWWNPIICVLYLYWGLNLPSGYHKLRCFVSHLVLSIFDTISLIWSFLLCLFFVFAPTTISVHSFVLFFCIFSFFIFRICIVFDNYICARLVKWQLWARPWRECKYDTFLMF